MAYLTSTTLVANVKRRASIPENQATFTTDDFLALANDEIDIGIVPLILSMQEEYFVHPETVALVASTSRYAIPYRAIGGKLRDLFYQDTNGNLFEMSRIAPEDKVSFQENPDSNTYFKYFYLEGNNVVISPNVGSSPVGSLVFTYYLRPNNLVDEDRIGVITAISVGASTTTYTLSQMPDHFSASELMDINQTKSGHKIRVFDILPSSINSGTKQIVFSNSDLPTDVALGDHIAIAGECFVPQIPSDLHNVLAQRVAQRCLESMGDQAGLQAATAKLAEMELKSSTLIDNRVEGAPMKVTNRKGLLRNSRLRRW
jgi:hypothetical protein